MKYFLAIFLLFNLYLSSECLSFGGLGKSAIDVTKGIAERIPDAIPSPEFLFESGKNVIAGYPFAHVNLI